LNIHQLPPQGGQTGIAFLGVSSSLSRFTRCPIYNEQLSDSENFMTYATDNTTQQALEKFSRFDADTKLALVWHGYLDIKDQLQPGTGNEINEAPALAVFHQIQALPQEEQLQAQCDIINGADSPITRAYRALHSSGRLHVWLLLGQGMEDGSVIPVPPDYQLPEQTQEFANQIKQLDFEERINFMRSAVVD
jgi:hypothetical protein